MNADTAPFGTRGTLCLQGTLHAALFWKVDHSSWSKGHFKRSRAADDLPLPVPMEFLFGKLFPLSDRPGFTLDLQLRGTGTNPMATYIGTLNMEFLQGHCLVIQVRTDGLGHAGFRSIGSGHANGSHHPTVPIMQDMALVPIDAYTATFASMPHLPILHLRQCGQHEREGFLFLRRLIPIPVQIGLQAGTTHQLGSCLLCDFSQLPLPLGCNHAHHFAQSVSHYIIRVFHASCSPQRATIEGGSQCAGTKSS